MKDFRFNYIITIHNKQALIRRVMSGLIACVKENSFIYPVLDGCTDDTEKVLDEVIAENPNIPIKKLYAPDVHELKTINTGLRAAAQDEKGCNIILQDDVIIDEPSLEAMVKNIYDHFGYSNVGYLSFRHGVNIFLKDKLEPAEFYKRKEKIIEERDLVESAYGTGMSPVPLMPHMLLERMVTVGSPQCISCEVVNELGVMDEKLAPVSYSCHDMSLRCLESGRHNYVFALKFLSEIEWGGTHGSISDFHMKVMQRNRSYLYEKHGDFIRKFAKTRDYYRFKTAKPFSIKGIPVSPEELEKAPEQFYKMRKHLVGLRIHWVSKFIKLPLKWVLIRLRLY